MFGEYIVTKGTGWNSQVRMLASRLVSGRRHRYWTGKVWVKQSISETGRVMRSPSLPESCLDHTLAEDAPLCSWVLMPMWSWVVNIWEQRSECNGQGGTMCHNSIQTTLWLGFFALGSKFLILDFGPCLENHTRLRNKHSNFVVLSCDEIQTLRDKRLFGIPLLCQTNSWFMPNHSAGAEGSCSCIKLLVVYWSSALAIESFLCE